MPPRFCLILLIAWIGAMVSTRASTTITFTRNDVANMANLFETDCVSISPLINEQYPTAAGTWDFIFPHSSISADADIHVDMGTDSSGAGSASNNTGASPLICEVINATSTQLNHLTGLNGQPAMFRGIFRFYTEHSGERHFELHPVTELQKWNGSTFVLDTDYHPNIGSDANGTTHATSTLVSLLDGSQTVTATASANNAAVTFTLPSPSVNYVQYDGVALTGIQSDALSQYFLFQPNLVPNAAVRCRIVANTATASSLSGLVPNQAVTVNALTRTDMAAIASQISSINGGQSMTFPRPVEFITLGVLNLGPAPTPSPSPGTTPTPSPTVTTFTNSSAISISGSNGGRGSPYPATISATGVPGRISKVTARLNSIAEAKSSDFASDLDIMMTNPAGQAVMLMSDAGGSQKLNTVTLTFDDFAATQLSQFSAIASGTYKPTNFGGDADAFPSPAPAGAPASALAAYNNTNPNGTWSLFVLDEYTFGGGSIGGGWTLSIETQLAAPAVTTNAATSIRSTSAVLNGNINPLGQLTTYQFQLGTNGSYTFAQSVQNAGNTSVSTPVSVSLSGLQPATTYNFRVTATNATGTTSGSDLTFTTAGAVDSDNDGMPNDFETANGFNAANAADAEADSDQDGMTNYQEYLAGTDPHSAASNLRIDSVERTDGDIVLGFPSVFGKTYRVEQTGILGTPWTILSDNIFGSGGPVTVSDVEAADQSQRRFYRVIVIP